MSTDRLWQIVTGFAPLLFAILYLWNPLGQRDSIFGIVLYSLAVWAAVRNPLKGKPRSEMAVCVGYGLTAAILAVNTILRQSRRDIGWVFVFLVFAFVWGNYFRRDTRGSAAVAENHG